MSQAMGRIPNDWNSMKAWGGMKPLTATARQPMRFIFSSISWISGMRSPEMPVTCRPSR